MTGVTQVTGVTVTSPHILNLAQRHGFMTPLAPTGCLVAQGGHALDVSPAVCGIPMWSRKRQNVHQKPSTTHIPDHLCGVHCGATQATRATEWGPPSGESWDLHSATSAVAGDFRLAGHSSGERLLGLCQGDHEEMVTYGLRLYECVYLWMM